MNDVRGLLRQLGSNKWEVARTLDWAGVSGQRRSFSRCPVANYLRLYYPNAYDVVVTPSEVCVWEESESAPPLASHVQTPEPVRGFIDFFDEGKYPRLDDRFLSLGSEFSHVRVIGVDAEPPVLSLSLKL